VRFRILPLLAALALVPAGLGAQARPDSLALARRYTAWFYAGQFDSLMAHQPAASRGDSTVRSNLARQFEQLTVRAGTETAVIEEKFVMRNGRPQYWRTARFSDFAEPILLRWVIDGNGEITGMGLGPLSQAPPIDPPR
jgi:hypothetical protein